MKFKLKSLECNIVHQCINRCVGCSHLSPINEPHMVEPEVLKRDLEKLAQVTEVPRFALLGGEPLLHPKLLELIDIAKSSGISKTICVTTNGQLLDRVPEEFWQKIDQLIISRYPGKLNNNQIEEYRKKFCKYKNFDKRNEFIISPISKFYAPISRNFLNKDEAQELFNKCPWKDHCTTVQDGYLYLCPQSLFFPKVFFNMNSPISEGLSLEGITAEKLAAFYYRKQAFISCQKCAYGTWLQWRETVRERWIEESLI